MAKALKDIKADTNDQIIEAAKNGDVNAFNKLVEIWFRRIFNFCYKYFGNYDLAMESTQKTFIALHQHLPDLRTNKSLKYWLYKVAHNHCHDEERKKKNNKQVSIFQNQEALNLVDVYHHPERKFNIDERQQWLEDMLGTLPEEQRVIIIMKEYENMKFREIAEVLKISENTVKSRLYYGLSNLRKIITKSGINYREAE